MARTVKCPSCGAELTVKDENRDFMFCEYCGTKVRLDDYQETHRFVDEARIQESKDAKELELKKMEFEEKKDKQALWRYWNDFYRVNIGAFWCFLTVKWSKAHFLPTFENIFGHKI